MFRRKPEPNLTDRERRALLIAKGSVAKLKEMGLAVQGLSRNGDRDVPVIERVLVVRRGRA